MSMPQESQLLVCFGSSARHWKWAHFLPWMGPWPLEGDASLQEPCWETHCAQLQLSHNVQRLELVLGAIPGDVTDGKWVFAGNGDDVLPGRAVGGRFQAGAGPSIPLTSILPLSPSGEQCGGCRRSNTTDRPHSFQVILTDRPSLELSADNEEDMADWMQYFCQAVSKGVSWGRALSVGALTPSFAQGAAVSGSMEQAAFS